MPIGDRLGTYDIQSALGAGGMGEVYRALDTKLGREVAIKVLPDAFVSDPERIARFEREARALASLNHPHIASLFGMEEATGRHFLVMELVEGDTLEDRVKRGPIRVETALALAQQIAEALEAAHEKGIVHRDLKPANVKITPDEKVKVLDFGLAKLGADAGRTSSGPAGTAQDPAPAGLTHSPTLSMMATQAGMILGTAAYMSPEQAKGLPADHRSDVFSLGSVLYEMLTGRAPFQGDTAPDVLASVLARDPDFTALPPNVNPRLVELLRRCLEKNPKRRWQAVGDLRAEIEIVAAAPHALPAVAIVAAPRPWWRRAMPALAAALGAAVMTSVVWWNIRPSPPVSGVTRFPITLGEGERFTDVFLPSVAIAPDGTQLVYVANKRLYVRSMSEVASRPIPGTEATTGFVGAPIFSPDSRSLAFWSGQPPGSTPQSFTLKRIALSGGSAVTICQGSLPFGTSWTEEGIFFGQGFGSEPGIMKVSPNGGRPELVVRVKNGEVAHSPNPLPGGDAILFTLATGFTNSSTSLTAELWDKARILVQPLNGGEPKVVVDGGSDGRYIPTGHLVYALAGALLAVPFDVRTRQVTGGPVPVVEGVSRATIGGQGPGSAQAAVSRSGALAYVPGPVVANAARLNIVLVDRMENVEPLKLPAGSYRFPRVSPDGRRMAVATVTDTAADVWIYDLAGASSIRQLTFGGRNRYPVWSGNEFVVFQSDREGDAAIFWQRADGATPAERLTKAAQGEIHVPEAMSPDGKTLLYDFIGKDGQHALWSFSLLDRKTTKFGDLQNVSAIGAVFSPDGKWLAYKVNRPGGGAGQIFVQPFPQTGARYLVGDGVHPLWSRDGKELSYDNQGQRVTVVVTTQPTFTFSNPTSALRSTLSVTAQERDRDSLPDGRSVALLNPQNQFSASDRLQIQFVLNWFEELKARVPVQ